MTLSRLVLFCALAFLSSSALAADENRCQKMISAEAKAHERATAAMLRKFEKAVNGEISRVTQNRSLSADAVAAVQSSVQRIRERANLAAARQAYVENPLRDLDILHDRAGRHDACADRLKLSIAMQANANRYQGVLNDVRDEITSRVDIADLDDGEGLVVIAVSGTEAFSFVRIDRLDGPGAILLEDTTSGEYFRIIKARAGRYVWDQMYQEWWGGKSKYKIRKRDFSFDVLPGALNLAGVLSVDSTGSRSSNIDFSNRVVIVLSKLEDEYPELLRMYPLANGLDQNDPFLAFYLDKRASFGNEAL